MRTPRSGNISINSQASVSLLSELSQAGFEVEHVSDLFNKRIDYRNAVPILLRWLHITEDLGVKEAIIRALSVRWAKPDAAQHLILEFHNMRNESNVGIKWAIANALSVVADDNVFDDLVNLAKETQHGKAREMLVLALGNMKDPRAQDELIDHLTDNEVCGHAIMALGKLKSKKAYSKVEQFLGHKETWIRKEAQKALLKIDRSRT